jgi:hypothetical protein
MYELWVDSFLIFAGGFVNCRRGFEMLLWGFPNRPKNLPLPANKKKWKKNSKEHSSLRLCLMQTGLYI